MEKPKILVVDDERFYINVLAEMLQDDYEVVVAKTGIQALQRVSEQPRPDMILLDWLMPEMDGLSVCKAIKSDPLTSHIPVIFLTIKSEIEDEIEGFEAGAADYIRKPMSPPIVMARVRTHLDLIGAKRLLQDENALLESKITERTQELERTKDAAIYCMASLAETRDNETGYHIRRTQHYVRALAEALRDTPGYGEMLTDEYIDVLFKSAPLHDIGKVGVPDNILLKPGRLNEEEWTEMKRHAFYGKQAIERAEHDIGSTYFLNTAKEIAYTHHEKWDGSGYPQGLSGTDIPLSGRLMALADVYDALISARAYKPAFTHQTAMDLIVESRGTHFDPTVIDAFIANEELFKEIALRYADETTQLQT